MSMILRFNLRPAVFRAMRTEDLLILVRARGVVPFWFESDCTRATVVRLTCHWRGAEVLAQFLRSLVDTTDDVEAREGFLRLLMQVETELARQPLEPTAGGPNVIAAGESDEE